LELSDVHKDAVSEMARSISVIGVEKIGLVKPQDDLSQIIFDAVKLQGLDFVDGDVVVISQKIVSKAEGLEVDISTIKPRSRARAIARKTGKDARLVQLILRDTRTVLRADRTGMIVRRKDGLICLNAGVDKSNVKGRLNYARLPTNSDLSACKIRLRLEQLSGKYLGVIIADTYSRPLRTGQVEFAIGVSGLKPIIDYRGLKDIFGYQLKYKFVALADEVAAAAELVMGQGTEHTPVAILRGLPRIESTDEASLSKRLLIGKQADLFQGVL
jgi:coenzyme F420-0:L-glutamate ligase/coenzyme F420-1:gamma-L-glutamate ligase